MDMLIKYAAEDLPTHVIYLDLANAFGKITHSRLTEKLTGHGIEGQVPV